MEKQKAMTLATDSRQLVILDTGDNYILVLKGGGYIDAIRFYKDIDLTINEIPTGHVINKSVVKFVHENIGRVIPYGFAELDHCNMITMLLTDIEKTISYYKVREFWDVLKKTPSKYEDKKNSDYINLFNSNDGIVLEKDNGDTIKTGWSAFDPSVLKVYNPDESIYIILNTIYNLSIVVRGESFTSNITEFTEMFPDFVIAVEIKDKLSDEMRKNLENIFHKKSFEGIDDIKKKFNAFKDLYNLSDNSGNEKERVKNYFNWNFTISNDVDKRMKANDLYKEVITHLCVPDENAAAFKKRLAGYLFEMNLQKKRFSDAYYFYGLEKKDSKVAVSLGEIEEKRKQEKKEWLRGTDMVIKGI